MDARRIEEIEAEVRHARQRLDLYRAKMYGPRPTEPSEMRELERVHRSAVERLAHARRGDEPPADEEDPAATRPPTSPGGDGRARR